MAGSIKAAPLKSLIWPFAEQHHERSTVAVANRVKFGVQAPFRAPDTSGNRPFFKGVIYLTPFGVVSGDGPAL